jgi:hypothetical protein
MTRGVSHGRHMSRGAAVCAGFVAAGLIVRRLGRRSGANGAEVLASLPGDALVPEPMWQSTRAITIEPVRRRRVDLTSEAKLERVNGRPFFMAFLTINVQRQLVATDGIGSGLLSRFRGFSQLSPVAAGCDRWAP